MTDAELRDFAKTTHWPLSDWEAVRRMLKDVGMVETEVCGSFEEYTAVTLQSLSDSATGMGISLLETTELMCKQWLRLKEKYAP